MSNPEESMLDVEQLCRWTGREVSEQEVITAGPVRRFDATFDRPLSARQAGDPVLRLLHFCLAQTPASTARLDVDEHPARGEFLPPVPLPRRMCLRSAREGGPVAMAAEATW